MCWSAPRTRPELRRPSYPGPFHLPCLCSPGARQGTSTGQSPDRRECALVNPWVGTQDTSRAGLSQMILRRLTEAVKRPPELKGEKPLKNGDERLFLPVAHADLDRGARARICRS